MTSCVLVVGAVVIIMIISISIAIIEEGIILPKEASDLSGCRPDHQLHRSVTQRPQPKLSVEGGFGLLKVNRIVPSEM